MLDWRTVKSVKGQTRGRICVAVGRTTRVIFGLYTSFPLEYGLHRNQQLESGQGRTRRGRLRGGKRTGRIDAKNPVPGALSVRTSHFSENYPNHSHHSDFFPILLTYVFFFCSNRYPVAYTFVVLPVSIVRWTTFTKHSVPDAATFFSIFLHDTFGAVNVILLLTTRQELLLFKDPREARAQHRATEMGRAPETSPSRASSSRSEDEIRGADAQVNNLEPLEEDIGLGPGHPQTSGLHDDYHAAYELSARGGGRMRTTARS